MNILMTGCGRGFGCHVREMLVSQGHHVYGVGLEGPNYRVDLNRPSREWDVIADIYDEAEEEFRGPVEVLINNAGVTHIDWTEDHPLEKVHELLNVNVMAPFAFCQELVRRVKAKKGSQVSAYGVVSYGFDRRFKIINTCSMSTRMGLRACPIYPASKAALESMTRCFSKEFAGRWPITVYGISPGNIGETHMVDYAVQRLQETRGMSASEAEKYNAQSPLGRYATHGEVWEMFNFVVNHAPEYMTGSIITMPNGMGLA